jgi:hypothetical protein
MRWHSMCGITQVLMVNKECKSKIKWKKVVRMEIKLVFISIIDKVFFYYLITMWQWVLRGCMREKLMRIVFAYLQQQESTIVHHRDELFAISYSITVLNKQT